MNKKLILFVVIFLVLGMAIYFLAFQKSEAPIEIPAPSTNLKTYHGQSYSFSYPADFLEIDQKTLYPFNTGGVAFRFSDTDFAPSSTISPASSGISLGVSSESSSTCWYVIGNEPQNGSAGSQMPTKAFGSLVFDKVEDSGCGAGTCTSVLQYSLIRAGSCYRFDLTIAEGNPGAYFATQEEINKAYSANAEVKAKTKSLFESLVSTFKFEE